MESRQEEHTKQQGMVEMYKRMKDGYREHRMDNEWYSGVVVSMEGCADQGLTPNLETVALLQTL